MATTTNFGWDTPDDTDYVTDGAAAMRELGQDIDTTLVDLKGGTTGQMLTKASNTDMDFTWASPNPGDITAVTAGTGISGGGTSGDVTITNSMATAIDAKGDLIAGTGADAFSRLAVGNNGETLVADSSTATGLRWQGDYAAGKNKILNSDYSIWQRGTTFTNPTGGTYTSDRWRFSNVGGAATSHTIDRQTFTPGTAPVAGYEGTYFLRSTLTTVGSSTGVRIEQRIEDVRTFAGQNVTLSFWCKSDTNRTNYVNVTQVFGSGGSAAVTGYATTNFSATSSWQRFTFSFTMPSISGKTIGTNSYLDLFIGQELTAGCVMDVWGVQMENASVATAFQTATGTIQGELAACQRYFFKVGGEIAGQHTIRQGGYYDANYIGFYCPYPVPMRTAPSITAYGNPQVYQSGTAYSGFTWNNTIAGNPSTQNQYIVGTKTSHGLTVNLSCDLYCATTSDYIGVSAEL